MPPTPSWCRFVGKALEATVKELAEGSPRLWAQTVFLFGTQEKQWCLELRLDHYPVSAGNPSSTPSTGILGNDILGTDPGVFLSTGHGQEGQGLEEVCA